MKYSNYFNIPYVLVMPFLFFVFIYNLAKAVEKNNLISSVLIYIGNKSLVIMYLHIGLNILAKLIFNKEYNPFIYVCIGISIPLLWDIIIQKNKITRMLFLGKV